MTSDVGDFMCAYWALSLAHHQSSTDSESDGVCRGPLLAPPSTSSRVGNRFSWWRLVMLCALTTTGVTGITSMHLAGVPWTIFESTVVCTGAKCSPVEYVWVHGCVRTLCDVWIKYLGGYMHFYVAVVFTLYHSFNATTSAASTPSVLPDSARER